MLRSRSAGKRNTSILFDSASQLLVQLIGYSHPPDETLCIIYVRTYVRTYVRNIYYVRTYLLFLIYYLLFTGKTSLKADRGDWGEEPLMTLAQNSLNSLNC